MEKLIKITDDHYVVVDDSEIKEGDSFYSVRNLIEKAIINYPSGEHIGKITHSTQPLEYFFTDPKNSSKVFRFDKVKYISLQEVKELIGEKSWKGYIDGTEWEVEIVDGKLKLL